MAGNKAVVQPLGAGASASAAPVYITVQSVLDGRVIAESTTKYQALELDAAYDVVYDIKFDNVVDLKDLVRLKKLCAGIEIID
ncbi:MAG: hypothetical protein II234_01080 [Clostridia bacterium]|nr:hypothetical protein [Clostridia bacterium]